MKLYKDKHPIIAEHGDFKLILLDAVQFNIVRKGRPITYHITSKSALEYWERNVGGVSAAQGAMSELSGVQSAKEYAALHAVFQEVDGGSDK